MSPHRRPLTRSRTIRSKTGCSSAGAPCRPHLPKAGIGGSISTRLTMASRLGLTKLREDVERSLGKAFEQLDRSVKMTESRAQPFADIPGDRPIIGFATTMEPYWFGNAPVIRRFLPELSVPVFVVSIRELEHLVSI